MTDPTADTSAIEAALGAATPPQHEHDEGNPVGRCDACMGMWEPAAKLALHAPTWLRQLLADNARLTAAYDAEVDLARDLDCQIARLTAALGAAEGELADSQGETNRLHVECRRLRAELDAIGPALNLARAKEEHWQADAATGRAVGRALADLGTVETSDEGTRVWFGGDPEYVLLGPAEAAWLASLDSEEGT